MCWIFTATLSHMVTAICWVEYDQRMWKHCFQHIGFEAFWSAV